MMRFWMRLGWLLEWIFGRFWDHLGGQVRAKLGQKSMKMESKTTSKNKVEIKRGEVLFWGGRRGSGDPLGRGI